VTTLIVSLGLLSGLLQSGVIVAAVALVFATQAVLDPGERMVYILTNMVNRIKWRGLLPSAVSFGVAGCLSSSTEEDEYPTATPDSDYCDCLPVRPPADGQSIPERLTIITMRLP